MGVGRKAKLCLWWSGVEFEDDGTISCGNVGHKIPRADCPACNGQTCEFTAKFIHFIWEDATLETASISNEEF